MGEGTLDGDSKTYSPAFLSGKAPGTGRVSYADCPGEEGGDESPGLGFSQALSDRDALFGASRLFFGH